MRKPDMEQLEEFARALEWKSRIAMAEAHKNSPLSGLVSKTAWVLAIDVSGRFDSRLAETGFFCLAPAGMRPIPGDPASGCLGPSVFYLSASESELDHGKTWSYFIKTKCRAEDIAKKIERRNLLARSSHSKTIDGAISLDEASALGLVDRKAALLAIWERMSESGGKEGEGGGIWGVGHCFETPEMTILEHSLKHG